MLQSHPLSLGALLGRWLQSKQKQAWGCGQPFSPPGRGPAVSLLAAFQQRVGEKSLLVQHSNGSLFSRKQSLCWEKSLTCL